MFSVFLKSDTCIFGPIHLGVPKAVCAFSPIHLGVPVFLFYFLQSNMWVLSPIHLDCGWVGVWVGGWCDTSRYE